MSERNRDGEPDYIAEPSYTLRDALTLPLLFHGGHWDEERKREWLRITGTTEATTKVMCDHLRSAIAVSLPARTVAPEGWRLVPTEMTQAMLVDTAAAVRDFYTEDGPYPRTKAMWRAALATAPSPPASETA